MVILTNQVTASARNFTLNLFLFNYIGINAFGEYATIYFTILGFGIFLNNSFFTHIMRCKLSGRAQDKMVISILASLCILILLFSVVISLSFGVFYNNFYFLIAIAVLFFDLHYRVSYLYQRFWKSFVNYSIICNLLIIIAIICGIKTLIPLGLTFCIICASFFLLGCSLLINIVTFFRLNANFKSIKIYLTGLPLKNSDLGKASLIQIVTSVSYSFLGSLPNASIYLAYTRLIQSILGPLNLILFILETKTIGALFDSNNQVSNYRTIFIKILLGLMIIATFGVFVIIFWTTIWGFFIHDYEWDPSFWNYVYVLILIVVFNLIDSQLNVLLKMKRRDSYILTAAIFTFVVLICCISVVYYFSIPYYIPLILGITPFINVIIKIIRI